MTDKRIFTVAEVTTAIVKAIDFLDKNPERHIIGDLAIDSNGQDCDPNDPDAQCFCMLGRISHELDLDGYPFDRKKGAKDVAEQLGIDQSTVFTINDSNYVKGTVHCDPDGMRNLQRSGRKVLTHLRKKLEKAGVEVRPS